MVLLREFPRGNKPAQSAQNHDRQAHESEQIHALLEETVDEVGRPEERIDADRVHTVIKQASAEKNGQGRVDYPLDDERPVDIAFLPPYQLGNPDLFAEEKHRIPDAVENHDENGKQEKGNDAVQPETERIQNGNDDADALELVPVVNDGFRVLLLVDIQNPGVLQNHPVEGFVLFDGHVLHGYRARERVLGFVVDNLCQLGIAGLEDLEIILGRRERRSDSRGDSLEVRERIDHFPARTRKSGFDVERQGKPGIHGFRQAPHDEFREKEREYQKGHQGDDHNGGNRKQKAPLDIVEGVSQKSHKRYCMVKAGKSKRKKRAVRPFSV